MKKMKKLLTGLLALVMAITTVAIQTPITAKAATPTIDTSKEVSLTIYKYRYDGDDFGDATGEMKDADATNGTIPGGAQLLNGVTFKVYKVADIVQEDNQLKYKTVDAIKDDVGKYITGGLTAVEIKTLFKANVLAKLTPVEATTKTTTIDGTATNGVAQFTNTMLSGQGLYLVVETDAPDVVTTMVDPFLISLPMTNVDGDDWLYKVYVFPKNGTTTGDITIKKTGKVGNGTATNVSAKFVLQKKIDGTWTTLTTDDDGGSIGGTNGVITLDATNGAKISGLSQGVYRFVEVEAPDDSYIMDGTAYVFVMDDAGKAYEYDASATDYKGDEITNATITATNYKPEVEKKVLEKGVALDDARAADWNDDADYSVGDHVQFKVTATVPENIALLKHYVLVDTLPTGLIMDATVDQNSFKVTYYTGSTADSLGTEVTNTGITTVPVYDEDENQWTFDLKDDVAALSTNKITAIEVTFTATLTKDAVTAGAGNTNEIGLEYTNKLYPDDYETSDDTPYEETKTITDKAVTYTFGIELDKTFTGSTPSDTIKATFDLYRPIATGETKTTTLKVTQSDGSQAEIDVIKIGTYTTDTDGKIIINTSQTDATTGDSNTNVDTAVSNGTYYFVETETASGYNLLKEPVAVEVEVYYTQTFETTTTVTKYDKDGNVDGDPVVTPSGTTSTTYYSDGTTQDNTTEITNTTTVISVVNNKGFTLPSTGGVGTYIFVFVGVSMMAAAVILFFTTKKKEVQKN